jgi:RNA polymerase primary sigma factor
LPQDARRNVYRLYRARNDLLQQLEREPRDVELAQATGLSVDEVRDLSQYLSPVLSLDSPLGEDDANDLVDIVPDPVAELQLSAALRDAVAEELERLLQRLTPEEKEVLVLRFGLLGQPLRSRQDVGKVLGLTNERVQRLEARALRKLRDPELLRQLETAMDQ